MKQFLLAFTFLLISNSVLSQNLTLAQILEIKKKDLGNAEEYLTAKGWEFKDAEEPTYDKLGKATFTYNKSDMSDIAESFLTFFYSNYSDKTRISIQVNKKAKYNEYINAIKSFGCKLIKSKVENGNIVKVYRGATTTFEVTSSTSSNFYNEETAIWHLFIATNEDYDLNWGEE
ncbi:hypothetical protein H6802_00025 [Candidatus Nomurabacteria bacterium]|nr:hypothetical protein [Candidatus Nomurabacteria bacterium]